MAQTSTAIPGTARAQSRMFEQAAIRASLKVLIGTIGTPPKRPSSLKSKKRVLSAISAKFH